MMKTSKFLILILGCLFVFGSCSINKMAINAVSNALTGEGSNDVFTGDTDPKLVAEALPFAIKLYETLLSKNPDHQGLLLTTGSLFIMYANAFVQGPAEMLPAEDFEEEIVEKQRAKKLYLRGVEILYTALDKKFPGFSKATVQNGTLEPLLKKCKKEDVALLYWTVAGGLAAYSIDVLDFDLGEKIPEWEAMIKRAYEINPDFNGAALDEFLLLFYASLPPTMGGNKQLAVEHFQKAIEKTNGASVGAYVSYAQSICVPAQDYDAFKDSLEKALAIDVDANPSNRLQNIINQRKASFLLDDAHNYFSFLPSPDYSGGW